MINKMHTVEIPNLTQFCFYFTKIIKKKKPYTELTRMRVIKYISPKVMGGFLDSAMLCNMIAQFLLNHARQNPRIEIFTDLTK